MQCPHFPTEAHREILWVVGFENLCQCLGPILLLPLTCCGTAPFWVSVSPSVKWDQHFRLGTTAYWKESQGKSQDPRVQPPSDFEDNTCSLLVHWSSVAVFSVSCIDCWGQLVRNVVLVVISWPVAAAPGCSWDLLPYLMGHLAGSAGLAHGRLSVRADSFRIRGVDGCPLG